MMSSGNGMTKITFSDAPAFSCRHRFAQNVDTITKEQVKAVGEDVNEEVLSIRALMAKQESDVIITEAREYQVELFEKAKQQNIIAVLDTGIF